MIRDDIDKEDRFQSKVHLEVGKRLDQGKFYYHFTSRSSKMRENGISKYGMKRYNEYIKIVMKVMHRSDGLKIKEYVEEQVPLYFEVRAGRDNQNREELEGDDDDDDSAADVVDYFP